jgi:Plasmid pRiA4b ORF-3-like protein
MKQEVTSNVLQFHIHLIGISPMIWRRIQMQLTQTLGDLHAAIQLAFGWSGLSLHQFKRKGTVYRAVDREGLIAGQDSGKITLEQLILSAGERFVYEYDFISGWCHQVRFEKTVVADNKVTTYPSLRCWRSQITARAYSRAIPLHGVAGRKLVRQFD